MASDDDLRALPLRALASALAAKKVSSTEATRAYLARIDIVEPVIHACTAVLREEALAAAKEADARLLRGERRSLLDGVPVTVKESLDLRGHPSTLGMPSRTAHRATDDAVMVSVLREAGAVFLAKTNVSQALLFHESRNPVFGETKNPWNTARGPGGSSGGEAAIIAAGGSPAGLGTDIGSSRGGTKIVDFGIAKAATQTTRTSAGVLKGKYTYMSPEQAAGEVVNARTDQFALGIVLWELLTMRRLFKRDTEVLTLEAIMFGAVPRASRFRTDVPKSIDDIVAKALSHDKKERFADCEQLALALEDALANEGIVHSQSRLAQYMRRMFADALAEEATLGLVNPDGSLSKNLTRWRQSAA